MLDDRERRVLAEIERGLSRQDAAFASRMRTAGEDRPAPTVLALCISLYISLPMVMLLFGWVAAVFTLEAFAVVIAVVLARRRSSRARR
ncbi:DUF3040 domain-containing protein [Actinoplanes sp. CA-051413]|jgi:small-conductance mechanosensitive channel|uniref:DUF3040 domain-containing protein n=1 Tax=Actinoplanes sp. CA-051413 TaxID=3239899 RepID=UPI003D97B677